MTIFLLVIAIVVLGVIQFLSLKNCLQNVEEDYSTSAICVEPEEQLDLILRFCNRSRMFIPYLRYQMTLPEGFRLADPPKKAKTGEEDRRFWQNEDMASGTVWLGPRKQAKKRIPIKAPGRGRYPLHELQLFGGDFFGMKENSRSTALYREIVVYPKEASLETLEDAFGGFLGDLSVRRFLFEDPVLTLGSRSYTGREPMKAIEWKQSARMAEMMVKNYDHTTEPTVSVVLDAASGGNRSKEEIERCFELTRAVCAKLEKKGAKYDFSMNVSMAGSLQTACVVTEGLGPRHFSGVLECLGRATDLECVDLDKLVQGRLQTASARGFVLITPERDEHAQRAIRAASASGAPVFVIAGKELER